jgi:ATP-binding cassette subfamily B protein
VVRLLRQYLRPYRGALAIVFVLLFIQAMANLYLPTLNADIINNGVITGDIDYILQLGAIMLVVTSPSGSARSSPSTTALDSDAFGRDVQGTVPPSKTSQRGRRVRHTVAHH